MEKWISSFKPCYKWNTFNTKIYLEVMKMKDVVLNLVISGIPSILKSSLYSRFTKLSKF